jgi:RNA polymerase sigma-70 factor (ECF subfamily)
VTPQQAFDTYHRAVHAFAYRLTRSADRADDITQECFLAYVRAPGRFDASRGTPKTYLFAIARNLAHKHYRDEQPEDPLEDSPAEVFSPDLAMAVEQAVSSLPVLQRESIVLFEYEGLTLEEIAQVTAADIGTIKSRLHRARERLKRILAPHRKVSNANRTV